MLRLAVKRGGRGSSSKLMEIRIGGLRLSTRMYLRVRFDVHERNHNLLLSAKSRTDGHIINRVIVSHGVPFNIKIPYFDINNFSILPPSSPLSRVFPTRDSISIFDSVVSAGGKPSAKFSPPYIYRVNIYPRNY